MADATPLDWRLFDMAEAELQWQEQASDSMLSKLSARGNMAVAMLGMLIATTSLRQPDIAANALMGIAALPFLAALGMSLIGTSIVKIRRPASATDWLTHVAAAADQGTSEQPLVRQLIEQHSQAARQQAERNQTVKPKVVWSGWLLLLGSLLWAGGLFAMTVSP